MIPSDFKLDTEVKIEKDSIVMLTAGIVIAGAILILIKRLVG